MRIGDASNREKERFCGSKVVDDDTHRSIYGLSQLMRPASVLFLAALLFANAFFHLADISQVIGSVREQR